MNINVVPPLAFTSAVNVTAMLYYHQNLITYDMLSPTFLTAAENVECLSVPQTVKEKIHSLVQPVGEEICGWLWEFRDILPSDMKLFDLLCWTPLGAVDYERTAEKCFVTGEMVHIGAFKLACVSGNFETIQMLWPEVKDRMLYEVSIMGYCLGENPKPLLLWPTIWTAYLNKQMDAFRFANDHEEVTPGESDVSYFCRVAVKSNNVGTANFFIRQLSSSEKTETIKNLIKGRISVHVSDFEPKMFLALLNQMDEESRREFLFRYPADVLLRILKWPSAHLFTPLSEFLWSVFPFSSLHKILVRICVKIMQMPVPAMYENIFITLWSKIPADKQREFFDNHLYNTIFNLFRPWGVEIVVTHLFKGEPNAYENFVKTFLENANAVCNMLVEENKFNAFKNILLQNFSQSDMVDDFESVYAQYTHLYIDEYYGVFNDSTSESNSESDIEIMDE